MYRNVEQSSRRHQLFGHYPIVVRGRRITAGMIVDENDRRRSLGDRLAEYLARMHEGRIEYAARDRDVSFEPMLRVEHGHVELFDRQIFHSRSEVFDDVARRTHR